MNAQKERKNAVVYPAPTSLLHSIIVRSFLNELTYEDYYPYPLLSGGYESRLIYPIRKDENWELQSPLYTTRERE